MDKSLEKSINYLTRGKIGIFPTDTAYGIGCRIDFEQSIKRIYEVRKRPHEKALLALVGSLEMARKYVEIPDEVEKNLINNYWPGGLTIILKCHKDVVPESVRASGETLAVRLPNHPTLQEIINRVGVPLVAPSANFSGEPTPFSLHDVDADLIRTVDFVMNGVCTIKGVSTIIDCTQKPWKVVRQGVIAL